jgi:ABC-type amino acid transport substrate-binding protein
MGMFKVLRNGTDPIPKVITSSLFVVTFLFCLAVAFPATAEESRLQKIIQAKEIRVGTSGDYQPFSYLNPKSGQYEGMDIEMAHKLGEALKAKVARKGDVRVERALHNRHD